MLDRRDFLRLCAGSASLLADRPSAGQIASTDRIVFRLKEAAGLRRFNYPVHARLPVIASEPGLRYRLLHQEKEVPAQFCRVTRGVDRPVTTLDFTASPGPFETRDYSIEFGATVKAGPSAAGRGLVAERGDGSFRVANGPYLTYTIPDDLAGLVSSIRTPELEFLNRDSGGLFLRVQGNQGQIPLKLAGNGEGTSAGWTRRGPVAVGLRFEGKIAPVLGKELRTAVDLTFVNSKSWIEAVWTVEDPEGCVASMGVDLGLKFDGSTALVDCGAGSTVYSHLRVDETLTLTGNPSSSPGGRSPRWMIEQGKGTARKPFAAAAPNGVAPEGWIHLMDRSRCSALAIADFGADATDRFLVEGGGRIEFSRQFPESKSEAARRGKSLRFWLHVVPMPVQVGAVTSPQAMLSPLMIEWEG